MAPFRDCFMTTAVAAEIEAGRRKNTAEQGPCGRGRDGDPVSAGAATTPEPTGAVHSGGAGVLPPASRGRRGASR